MSENANEGIRPRFSKQEDEIALRVGETVGSVVKETVREEIQPIKDAVSDIEKKVSNKDVSGKGVTKLPKESTNEISDIISKARERTGRSIKDISVKDSEVVKKHEDNHDFDCPTCHEHSMKINPTSMTAKCTGANCHTKVALVPGDSDAKCMNCGLPIKKTPDIEGCPFCGHDKAAEFDWSMIKNKRH